jgi:CheY-like chemotaxis protein
MLETREVALRCVVCRSEKKFNLTLAQKRQLSEGSKLQFQCSYCGSPQHWEALQGIETTSSLESIPVSQQPKSILVVDDDELTVKLLQKVLEAWDAKVETAESGKEALRKLAAESFDLLVCDIRMPEMTGQELFQHVQENGYLPPQRILFLTGEKSAAVKEFLDRSGCYYLYKPLQFLDFSGQIEAVLAGDDLP